MTRYKYIGIPQVYMTTLAICDLSIGVFTLWRELADTLFYLSDAVYWFCSQTYFPIMGLDVSASITASIVAMTLSVDRYLALKYPMKHSEYWSVRKAKLLAVIVGCLSIIPGTFYPLQFAISSEMMPGSNMYPVPTNLGMDLAFFATRASIVFLFRFAIPFTVTAVTNTLTVSIIRKSDKFRRGLDREARSNTTTPKCLAMTVGIVIAFFVTQIPMAAFYLYAIVFPEYTYALDLFEMLCNTWTKLNSIVNIVIYLTLNKEFRHTLFGIFCRGDNT
ncbi:hypothetical protein CAPTEDRAFT_189081 [Capitella teleta]|uniref:G-protein coupled receptors family 1 profile domain-containing protein n=1 Tax=Capitella teleta TaxID=283909 RepID=R7UJT5_CAPTE|nr:hypothetical protein CAPTEDRAFT_189081 [Capitella teleta]|eukprot:ELU04043.1 hypothetical protein CAPTEDRAFT_189081 [Capitella teleta]